jgi:hypothetical protein
MEATMDENTENWMCIADGARGIYVPQFFAEMGLKTEGVKAEDLAILAEGPDHEFYWEAWDDVLRDGVVILTDGQRCHLYQDGDLFLVPIETE